MTDTLGWAGKKVRHPDGRSGVVASEYIGFGHAMLTLRASGASDAVVQLNAQGRDGGEPGWEWLCENFTGGPRWLPLGDHNA